MKEKIPSNLIPSTINECDKEIYHLLFVDSRADYKTKEFKHSVVLKKFNQMSFEVSKDQFPKLGYTNVHILHDPTLPELVENQFNIDRATGDEIRAFAIENEIELQPDALVKDIRDVVREWIANN